MAIKKTLLASVVALAMLAYAYPALAATLSRSSGSTNVTAGDIVTVRVSVNAGGTAINTAEGTLQFPTDVLQALSLDKSSSIFSIWVEDPSFSNQSGQVSFSGGLPNPGYSGTNGTVLTVSFRAKTTGVATLSLANAVVRANDGLGTNVLQSTGTLQLKVISAPAATPAPTQTTPPPAKTPPAQSAPVVVTPPETTPAATPVAATPKPVLNLVPAHMYIGDQLSVSGHAPQQDAQVYLYIAKDGGDPSVLKTTPDTSGAFSFSGPVLEKGTYEVWAEGVSQEGVLSDPTDTVRIIVGDEPHITIGGISVSTTSLLLLLLAFLALACAVALVGWYKVYQYRHTSEALKMQKNVHRAFVVFKDGIEKHIEALDDATTKRELSSAETKLKTDLRTNLSDLEKFIQDELG